MDFAEKIRSFVEDALGLTDGAFGVDGTEMLIQIASTILLFLIVRFFFWNKVTAYIEGRKKAMQDEYENAKKANQDATLELEKAEKELLELRQSSKGILDEARTRGLDERKDILSKAKNDATKLIDDAHQEIDSQIEKAKKDINDQIVSVATLMAEKIIKKEIDETNHRVEDYKKSISKLTLENNELEETILSHSDESNDVKTRIMENHEKKRGYHEQILLTLTKKVL